MMLRLMGRWQCYQQRQGTAMKGRSEAVWCVCEDETAIILFSWADGERTIRKDEIER